MKKMRICYLASAKSIHVKRWAQYFAQRGHEVHVISLMPSDTDSMKTHILKKSRIRIKILSYALDSVLMFFKIRKLLKEINPDILHAHYVWDYGISGALMGFRPFVISVWGSDVLVVPKKSPIYRLIIASSLRRADVITTTAVYMGSHLENEFDLPKEKIIRIPWGVDLSIFCKGYNNEVNALKKKLNIPEGVPVIISNRNMTPLYNVESIVEAAYNVTLSHPKTVFIILRGYGHAELEEKMKMKAEALGISQNIRFIPDLLTQEEMTVFLNAADIFISIPKTDQFASSIMEGMACGLIPIVTTMKVYTQYLQEGENAFFVNPDDPQEIAEKIIYCIEHPGIKEHIYKINKKIIEEEEDWTKNARKMEELYETLLERMT
ncbi:MAG: glycosyltransferase family 4 protein [Theionarchaea archaeon]|nr:glycosyltransferase family 4 protein [Theionarchaea archaeon]